MSALRAARERVVLVDSTVWIDLLRRRDTARVAALRDLLAVEAAALSALIYQEVLQGAASAEHFARLCGYFSTLPMLGSAAPIRLHESAAELYARCRWAGVTPRNGYDCLIAQTAIEHGVELLAHDRDFDAIARIESRLRIYRHAA
jgi:predicted nucleic acid-binding protein